MGPGRPGRCGEAQGVVEQTAGLPRRARLIAALPTSRGPAWIAGVWMQPVPVCWVTPCASPKTDPMMAARRAKKAATYFLPKPRKPAAIWIRGRTCLTRGTSRWKPASRVSSPASTAFRMWSMS